MKTVDLNFFPGFVRKSMTFTIDDGNVRLDRKFLSYVKEQGFLGTFNLVAGKMSALDPAGYRAFYEGFEIANHCKLHPYALDPEKTYDITQEPFDAATADPAKLYPVEGRPGFYHFAVRGNWREAADRETYLCMVDEGKAELEEIFGKGSVRSYVWPYGEQSDPVLFEEIAKRGYYGMRKTGNVDDSTGFALPADRTRWSYNANYINMTECAKKYEAYPDDGELKFFCFGVHSHDFENNHCWDILADFVGKYGNRPEDFWYASVGDIFAYEDAIRQVTVTDGELRNPTGTDLWCKINGKRKILRRHSTIAL